jgi:hypothetical protein
VLPACGGVAAAGKLVAAEAGAVDAKRIPAAFRIEGAVLDNELPVYKLEGDVPFLGRSGLERTEAFRPSEEHWSSQ